MATATQTIDTHHTESLHDAILDYYGKRLATCSSDQTIKIFDVAASGTNTHIETLRGHEGPVWQLSWAHPKFGTILASAGYDGKVIIWREQGHQWSKLTEHAIHSASVNGVTWAPHELGAVLACASADGKVSILEFKDDGSWETRSFSAHAVGVNAISWAPSTVPGSLISTVGNAPGANSVKRFVTAGCDSALKIWAYEVTQQTWLEETSLEGHTDWVRDVSWAPNMGLPKSYIASGSQDRTVLIWTQIAGQSWVKTLLREEPFSDTIWKVSWSESGNLLAVSCGDGKVYIYKETGKGWVELPGAESDGTASSFQFANEDHTLGNALRYMIIKNPLVEFCGYSIPHPSEPLMNIRVQTYPVTHPSFQPVPGRAKDEPYTALEALEKGLDDLIDLCDVMSETFQESLDQAGTATEDTEMQE